MDHDSLTRPCSGPVRGAGGRTGAPRRPRSHHLPLGFDPVGGAAAQAWPRQRLDWPPRRRPERLLSDHTDRSSDRCGPTTERFSNCRRRGGGQSPRTHGGLDSSGASPAQRRHPAGVEHAVLLRRSVGTERFLGRRRCTATVAFSKGEGGLIP